MKWFKKNTHYETDLIIIDALLWKMNNLDAIEPEIYPYMSRLERFSLGRQILKITFNRNNEIIYVKIVENVV